MLTQTDFVILLLTTQKNGTKVESFGHGRTGHPQGCPVAAMHSPNGIPLTPWLHQQDASLKFPKGQQVATDQRGRHHIRHQSRCPSDRPRDWVQRGGHQRMLPTSRRGHGCPHGAGVPRYHPPGGGVEERYNSLLPPHKIEEFHRRTIREDVPIWYLCAHSTGASRKLVPKGT